MSTKDGRLPVGHRLLCRAGLGLSRQSAGTAASRALPEVGRLFLGKTRIRCSPSMIPCLETFIRRPGRGGTYLRWRIRTLLCERLFALSFQEKPSDSDLAGDHVFDCSYASLPDAEFDPGLSDGTETPRHMPHEPAHPLVLGPRVRIFYLQGLQLLASAHRDVQNATAVS